MISYLQGMLHTQEQINTKTFADNFDLPFTEAILYLKDRVSLQKKNFTSLMQKQDLGLSQLQNSQGLTQ